MTGSLREIFCCQKIAKTLKHVHLVISNLSMLIPAWITPLLIRHVSLISVSLSICIFFSSQRNFMQQESKNVVGLFQSEITSQIKL